MLFRSKTKDILLKYKLWKKIPVNVQAYIKKGIKDKKLETPKINNKIFSNVKNSIIGSNYLCLKSIHDFCKKKQIKSKKNGPFVKSLIANDEDTIKQLYGEVNTPFKLVEEMLAIIPKAKFKDPNLKWLDAGTGKGNFAIMLYFKLMEGLHGIIINLEERKNHIIKNMIYMFEIQDENRKRLREIFGQEANIYGD